MPSTSPTDPTTRPGPATAEPRGGGVSALLASLTLHFLMLLTLGLAWYHKPAGTGSTADRPIGIAVVHRLPDRQEYVDAAELAAEPTQEESSQSASAAAPPPADAVPELDLAGVLKEVTETPSSISGSGLAGTSPIGGDDFADTMGSGEGTSQDPAKKKASLFGVSGFGSTFVYVMDRSDSMNGLGGRPLRAAKTELTRSLDSLSELQRFQIVFYNDKPNAFRFAGGAVQLVQGESTIVNAAKTYVQSIRAYGGTEHAAAIKMALRAQPDVIFFLTDARVPRLSGSQLSQIRTRARRSGTTIHAIEFGTDPAPPVDSFLIDLAKQNGGEYQYINVAKL